MMDVDRNTTAVARKTLYPCIADPHRRLAEFNQKRLSPAFIKPTWMEDLTSELDLRILEGHFVEEERMAIAQQAAHAPRSPDAFVDWFANLRINGPGQNDPLFPWLAEHATLGEMRWFLTQELAGEAGFDDLVAMTQVKFDTQAKLELARNYWDEMGRGCERGMHGLMLDKVAEELDLNPRIDDVVSEALALANLMVALASNRRYAYHAIGALGVVELTAPGRVCFVNEGLRRLDVSVQARSYFQLHAGLDIKHSAAWNREVLRPLVAADPQAAQPIAEGALLRLECGRRCFARYRQELGLVA